MSLHQSSPPQTSRRTCRRSGTVPTHTPSLPPPSLAVPLRPIRARDLRGRQARQFGVAPDVKIEGRTDLDFEYVPDHAFYILLELLKNSMRASCEASPEDPPAVRVVVADGEANEDVALKVSDEGGGIARSDLRRVWSYLYTTASRDVQARGFSGGGSDFAGAPLAGLGYGLPISRAYARYFGGDLTLMSMEGFGTDAFVYLSRLGDHDEPLP